MRPYLSFVPGILDSRDDACLKGLSFVDQFLLALGICLLNDRDPLQITSPSSRRRSQSSAFRRNRFDTLAAAWKRRPGSSPSSTGGPLFPPSLFGRRPALGRGLVRSARFPFICLCDEGTSGRFTIYSLRLRRLDAVRPGKV
jgi:hypothetical protein